MTPAPQLTVIPNRVYRGDGEFAVARLPFPSPRHRGLWQGVGAIALTTEAVVAAVAGRIAWTAGTAADQALHHHGLSVQVGLITFVTMLYAGVRWLGLGELLQRRLAPVALLGFPWERVPVGQIEVGDWVRVPGRPTRASRVHRVVHDGQMVTVTLLNGHTATVCGYSSRWWCACTW
jgi:hypothetical protein